MVVCCVAVIGKCRNVEVAGRGTEVLHTKAVRGLQKEHLNNRRNKNRNDNDDDTRSSSDSESSCGSGGALNEQGQCLRHISGTLGA